MTIKPPPEHKPTPAELLSAEKHPGGIEKVSRTHKHPRLRRVWECRLRTIRTGLGLTQREVAAAVGLSAAGYNAIETHGTDPMLSTAVTICEFFGVKQEEAWTKHQPKPKD